MDDFLHKWWLVFVGSFLIVLLRLPSLFEPHWYLDELIYLAIGKGIQNGYLLYRDLFDHKPPGVYLISAILNSQFLLRFLLIFLNIWALVAFHEIIKEFKNKALKILLVLGFLLLTATPLLEGTIFNAEIVILPLILTAFYLLKPLMVSKSVKRSHQILIGILLMLACLFKATAVFDALGIGLGFFIISQPKLNVKNLLTNSPPFLLGLLTPLILVGAYFIFHGIFNELLQATVFYNFGYVKIQSPPLLLGHPLTLLLKIMIIGFIAAYIATNLDRRQDKLAIISGTWFLSALLAVSLSNRPYSHYLIQLVPPILLVFGALFTGPKSSKIPIIVLLIFSLIWLHLFRFTATLPFPYYKRANDYFVKHSLSQTQYNMQFESQFEALSLVAQYIKLNSKPKDLIWVIGEYPQVYFESERYPPTIYMTIFQLEDSLKDGELAKTIEKHPPLFIVFIKPESFYRDYVRQEFADYLNLNYQEDQKIEKITVFKRR